MRQSVKAIAVSVSNTIDRAELDRLTMKKINESIADLETRSKQHFYRLNDHILKVSDIITCIHNLNQELIQFGSLTQKAETYL